MPARIHGHSNPRTPTYNSWQSLIQRATNLNREFAKNHGGRGITVCASWRESFVAFLHDMGERPEGTEIDRIDNEGNYEPGNCHWATEAEQARNKRSTRMFEVRGVKGCLADLARLFKIDMATVRYRLQRGRSPEEAFTAPVNQRISDARRGRQSTNAV